MAAYIIVDVEITDPVRYAEYISVVPPTIAKYGGGYWEEKLRASYRSDEYTLTASSSHPPKPHQAPRGLEESRVQLFFSTFALLCSRAQN